MREIAADQDAGDRRRVGSLKFRNGVEGFAKTDQRIVVRRDHWDADLDLIGTPNGIVNLVTGELVDPEPDYFITRSVSVDPDLAAECPRWLSFLNQLTNGDAALRAFLQEWAGYSLTGETKEQKLVFIHGPGGTGKSTFANIILRIAGDYGMNAAMETLADSKFEQHPEQLARLDGPRMVVAGETEAGHKIRENRIKLLTGGDKITARFMRQNSFDFMPKFKLTFLGNHQPQIANLDDAIRRRFIVVPFIHRPAEPDFGLEEALMAEAPGILRWMLRGAEEWYRRGKLILPKAITEATTRYFDDQDLLGQWIEEFCEVGATKFDRAHDLFTSWSHFATANGIPAGTAAGFKQMMSYRGFESKQSKVFQTKAYFRIKLK
ncbi:phage/plasmid primase, P4 family [Bradyrhizobium sp.]|jgi:putative DNA primase/helicase|uniref:phage/plasmid primase, P4 family n=1 Tax=Bradyrhizobium sp. TaxID=376 RepID=UPI002D057AE2|nr:phage/plasmid primase, P4 family [Bradyrhizobium sp.]HWX60201.1 phage/plasmid primase, P4 family [Bradyrhizobium sp.]